MKRIIINGQETDYLVSEEGEVFSEKTKKFLIGDISTGYKRVLLCLRDGTRKRFTIHFLVANAFLENKNNLPIVHHKDGNKLNNNVSNLAWINYSENVKKENTKEHPIREFYFTEEELSKEEWRPFRGTYYWGSNLGRLKNQKTKKIVKGHSSYVLGYIRDTLCLEDKRITLPRHRIIYECFFPNEKIDIINHKDGVRFNNRLINLENVTSSENLIKAYRETKTRKTRKCLCVNGEEKIIFFSISDAAKYFSCDESQIRSAMNRKGSYKKYKVYELSEEEYNQSLVEGSETIERIIREKNSNE